MSDAPTPARIIAVFAGTRVRVALTMVMLAVLLALAGLAWAYRGLVHGGMRARQEPPALEAAIARRLLDLSIPATATAAASPLDPASLSADVEAGRQLYQRDCAVCHAADGSGRTATADGLYPRPRDLHSPGTAARSDGALAYLIANGIRNTGMPGWLLPERSLWQLVAYLRRLPVSSLALPAPAAAAAPVAAHYVGSASCRSCHQALYTRWQATLMANVVRDPRQHPEAIIPDLARHDALVTFTKDDIALVYGSRWKQRYLTRVGDDYYPLPAQWDVTHQQWRKYFVKDNWWTPYYPPDNTKRPTSTLCDGCHSVNFDIVSKTPTEWNVGCEKCHGAGSAHLAQPVAATIINPARLDFVSANDSCIQCHSQGRPPGNPIAGKYYDWPVGFHMGKRLSDFWALEPHTPGETTLTHFADGTANKHRMQGNDFVTSAMYTHGVTCTSCHDPHGSDQPGMLRKPAAALCLDCHQPGSANGPRAPTLNAHTHHAAGSPGSDCVACHMPLIAETIGDVKVRSHTFRFVSPATSESAQVPNACNACHGDKPASWTITALRSWLEQSPWRAAR